MIPAADTAGRISAVQTFGTLDGPGIRFVAFLQGCPLRCACCHNPETWDPSGGKPTTAAALSAAALRYRSYYDRGGGVTLSGGEPLLQPAFSAAFFSLCHAEGLHTCLDTSGCVTTPQAFAVLDHTDLCLLDIKYPTDEGYRAHVGCPMDAPLAFLRELDRRRIPTRLRQVVIPGLNDDPDGVRWLARLAAAHPCVEEVELLPFRKLCTEKYDRLGLPFPLRDTPELSPQRLDALRAVLLEN